MLVVVAMLLERSPTSRLIPDSIDQIAAQVNVDNDGIVLEVVPDVAVCAGKVGQSGAP